MSVVVNPPIAGVPGVDGQTISVTFPSTQEITITAENDSIQIGDGTHLADVTTGNALKTDSSATTQPISAASLPLPAGASTASKQDTGNTSLASIDSKLTSGVPVTGTFYQATQPVSGTVTANTGLTQPLTDAQLRASSVPVSGTFWQATQPISGTVTANTGLSQPLTDTQLRATAVPVSGSFYQATQPVSLATAPTTPVTGTFWQATQPISAAALPLPSGAATLAGQTQPGVDIGDVTINNATGAAAVNIQDGGNSITVDGSVSALQTDVTTTGSLGSLNSTLDITCTNLAAVRFQVSGTFVGTISFLTTTNGTDYDANYALDNSGAPTGNVASSTPDSGTIWKIDVTGIQTLRLQMTAYTSGSASITAIGSKHTSVIQGIMDTVTVAGNVNVHLSLGETLGFGQSIMAESLPVTLATDQTVLSITSSNMNSIDAKTPSLGQTNMIGSSPVVIASDQTSIPVAATLSAETTKVIGTINIGAAQTVGLVAGSAVIGHVIADTGSTTSVTGNVATTIADGVNVTFGAKADAKSTATDTTAISAMSVLKQISASVQAPPSQTVTNAGTFVTQSTLAAETTKVIGTVNVASAQTIGIAAGSAVIGHVIADSGSTTVVTGNVASTVADGANVTLGAKADAKNTATDTTAISMMSVLKQISSSCQAPPSSAVTNTGTFAVQATLQAASGIDIGKLTANQSTNTTQVNSNNIITSVTGIQDVMPRKRTGTTGLSPNYTASRITSKTTTTITAATAYISAIVIACSAAGTTWTLDVQNKEGTPKILIPSFTLTVPVSGLPIVLQFEEPILMTSGIDIVTAGTTAGTLDIFITYWQ